MKLPADKTSQPYEPGAKKKVEIVSDKRMITVKLALLGKGKLFGAEDLIDDMPYRSSLICSLNDSVIYILSRSEFFRVFKSNEDVWKKVLEFAIQKDL